MNPKLFFDQNNNLTGAFEINRHAHQQEKHQAYLEAEWKYTHQQPSGQKPDRFKIVFARFLAGLAALIQPFTPARRQQSQF